MTIISLLCNFEIVIFNIIRFRFMIKFKLSSAVSAFFIVCFFTISPRVLAQNSTLNGTVTDDKGTPLIGVTVLEKGTNNGTITDIEGNFSISTPPNAIITFTYIGFASREVERSNKNFIDVTLSEDTELLDEVVVIGYGTTKKADLTGSITNVSGDKLSAVRATSLSQALQGLMPGVQVTRGNTMPGSSATIRVRGVTTIGNSDPLIIVDGVPGTLSTDVEDIESITVLKDAASASIYGARAASGVILITTKRGKEDQLGLEYSGTLGVSKATQLPGVVDYKRYMEMINEIAWNDGGNVQGNEHTVYSQDLINNYAQKNIENPNEFPITDWASYIIKDYAPLQKHNISASYGNNIIKSRAMIGYERNEALYNNRDYTAINARTNNDIKINKYISASIDGSYLRRIYHNPVVNPMKESYIYAPIWTPLWSDGRISGGRDGSNIYARINYGGFKNTWSNYLTGKFTLNITPIKNLIISAVYAPTVFGGKDKSFIKQIPYHDSEDPNLLVSYINGHFFNNLEELRDDRLTITKQLLANYSTTINDEHDFSLMAGYEDFYSFSESLSANSKEMELSEFPYLDRGNLANMLNSGNASEYAYSSLFGRVNYDFLNKYLLQANIRFDNSSRFHKNYRLGIFPSFSAGWVMSEEQFFKNLNLNPVSFVKLRGSWGSLGNERIGNYPYQSIMSFSNALFIEDGNVVSKTTSSQRNYNIEDITWETTETWNGGLDLTLFQNRFSLSADYYEKTTKDMLLTIEIPNFLGYDNPNQNAGTMYTKGWDLNLGWRERINDFTYSIGFNISNYKSKMGSLAGTVFDGATIIREGSQYNEWYGYVSEGLFQTQEDVESSPLINSSVQVGDVKYKDISGPEGVPDGIISPEYDRVLLGSSLPQILYGGSIDLDFKGLDLRLVFQGVGKQKSRITSEMVWQQAAWNTFPDFIDGNYFSHYNTAEKNASVFYPRLSQIGAAGNNYKMSDYWLFDGSYFRLKNIVLGYTLPKKTTDYLNLSHVRVFTSITDLFSIDKFPKGWDPEASSTGSSYINSTFNLGLSIKL